MAVRLRFPVAPTVPVTPSVERVRAALEAHKAGTWAAKDYQDVGEYVRGYDVPPDVYRAFAVAAFDQFDALWDGTSPLAPLVRAKQASRSPKELLATVKEWGHAVFANRVDDVSFPEFRVRKQLRGGSVVATYDEKKNRCVFALEIAIGKTPNGLPMWLGSSLQRLEHDGVFESVCHELGHWELEHTAPQSMRSIFQLVAAYQQRTSYHNVPPAHKKPQSPEKLAKESAARRAYAIQPSEVYANAQEVVYAQTADVFSRMLRGAEEPRAESLLAFVALERGINLALDDFPNAQVRRFMAHKKAAAAAGADVAREILRNATDTELRSNARTVVDAFTAHKEILSAPFLELQWMDRAILAHAHARAWSPQAR